MARGLSPPNEGASSVPPVDRFERVLQATCPSIARPLAPLLEQLAIGQARPLERWLGAPGLRPVFEALVVASQPLLDRAVEVEEECSDREDAACLEALDLLLESQPDLLKRWGALAAQVESRVHPDLPSGLPFPPEDPSPLVQLIKLWEKVLPSPPGRGRVVADTVGGSLRLALAQSWGAWGALRRGEWGHFLTARAKLTPLLEDASARSEREDEAGFPLQVYQALRVGAQLADLIWCVCVGRWAEALQLVEREPLGGVAQEPARAALQTLVTQLGDHPFSRPLQTGDVLGSRQWSLLEALGARCWRAIDETGQLGVLEELWPLGGSSWGEETQKQTLSFSQLTHPQLNPVGDWGQSIDGARWFIVSPFCIGESLEDRCLRRPLSEAEARAFFIQLLDGLVLLHDRSLLHLQIHPALIRFIDEEQVILLRPAVHRHDVPPYFWSVDPARWNFLAPELKRGERPRVESDLYALAATLRWALSPAGAPTPLAFHALLSQALEHDPDARFPNASTFLDTLKALKPLYRYRGEGGERDGLSLSETVALIIRTPDGDHQLWQENQREWVSWHEVDELEQVIRSAQERELIAPKGKAKESIRPPSSLLKRRANRPLAKPPSQKVPRPAPQLPPPRPDRGELCWVEVSGERLRFRFLSEGEFQMGDPRGWRGLRQARPVHSVKIKKPFLLLEGPVSQRLFESIMGYNPSYFWGPDRPVEMVSWVEAARFCNRLSVNAGLSPIYLFEEAEGEALMLQIDQKASGYRLPKEAEWAYAAHGERGVPYPGGRWEEGAWFRENANQETQPVGLKAPSEWGFYDLCGNVSEWCHDRPRAYGRDAEVPRRADERAAPVGVRALRGGSWRQSAQRCWRWSRAKLDGHGLRSSVGFRLARNWELH
ncbi:MAG: SUMF1/EgtB/PvdO family nonheme iron enzyme [Myxococcota bacterium]|nr:SUMF1/EgtB/PvdO family nonheme iron enzyme [Myxococcota bacterium]